MPGTVQRQVLASGKPAVGSRQDAHATAGEGHGEAVEKNKWYCIRSMKILGSICQMEFKELSPVGE